MKIKLLVLLLTLCVLAPASQKVVVAEEFTGVY